MTSLLHQVLEAPQRHSRQLQLTLTKLICVCAGLIGATATALEVQASGAIVFGGISDNVRLPIMHGTPSSPH